MESVVAISWINDHAELRLDAQSRGDSKRHEKNNNGTSLLTLITCGVSFFVVKAITPPWTILNDNGPRKKKEKEKRNGKTHSDCKNSFPLPTFAHFLDGFSHLYKRLCPSVGRSVRPSVRTRVEFSRNRQNSNKIASGIKKYAI